MGANRMVIAACVVPVDRAMHLRTYAPTHLRTYAPMHLRTYAPILMRVQTKARDLWFWIFFDGEN
jgi:hypothetical protein